MAGEMVTGHICSLNARRGSKLALYTIRVQPTGLAFIVDQLDDPVFMTRVECVVTGSTQGGLGQRRSNRRGRCECVRRSLSIGRDGRIPGIRDRWRW